MAFKQYAKYLKLMESKPETIFSSLNQQLEECYQMNIKATDTLNLEFNDKLFNLTIINIKVHKEGHLEFNFKDGSTINIDI